MFQSHRLVCASEVFKQDRIAANTDWSCAVSAKWLFAGSVCLICSFIDCWHCAQIARTFTFTCDRVVVHMEHSMHSVCSWCAVIDPSKTECFDVFNSFQSSWRSVHVSSLPCEASSKNLRFKTEVSDVSRDFATTNTSRLPVPSMGRAASLSTAAAPDATVTWKISKEEKEASEKCLSCEHIITYPHLISKVMTRACLMSSSVEIFFSSTSRLAASGHVSNLLRDNEYMRVIWAVMWYDSCWEGFRMIEFVLTGIRNFCVKCNYDISHYTS